MVPRAEIAAVGCVLLVLAAGLHQHGPICGVTPGPALFCLVACLLLLGGVCCLGVALLCPRRSFLLDLAAGAIIESREGAFGCRRARPLPPGAYAALQLRLEAGARVLPEWQLRLLPAPGHGQALLVRAFPREEREAALALAETLARRLGLALRA
ncbi:hypothetical protein JYK14_18285 [Siccirubricoccus sp. KC 17139]|uniref:DUF2244 domain-containing protein n=1 Tax=Siccirubricoccus soli TaxID=2899147 RepID=A0ABT1D861_9PROT|nr:hypothetical protein [Siccirubricoccus soli]MCO6418096.1 hypothetical protein [Siccirubricoccus soli]MCP2684231.1 hypothetical protein [Siccirubricoccus soli]